MHFHLLARDDLFSVLLIVDVVGQIVVLLSHGWLGSLPGLSAVCT